MKKFLSIILIVLMIASVLQLSASAISCGDNLTATFENYGSDRYPEYHIIISGIGDMYDYDYHEDSDFCYYTKDYFKVTIEDGVTSIGDYAFYHNYPYLESLKIGKTVTRIGYRAFCLTRIGPTFAKPTLISLTIPCGVVTIDSEAFYGQSGITDIVLSKNLKEIGYKAFRGCSALELVHYLGTESDWNSISIDSDNSPLTDAKRHFCTPLEVSEATCTKTGVVNTWYCSECDETFEGGEEIEITDHTYTSTITTQPTHLAEGVETFTCECGDTYTEPVAKITEHTYAEVVTAPTCTAQGYTTYSCACGDSYVDNYTDKLEHKYTSETTTPATHLAEGIMTYNCICGDTYTEAIAKLTEHTYAEVVTAPTCTVQGYTTFTCKCGDSYISDYVVALGHKLGEFVVTKESTCTENGEERADCSRCDYFETKELVTSNHKDENLNGSCDNCEEYIADKDCLCICHAKTIGAFVYKLFKIIDSIFNVNLVEKVFGITDICVCGIKH